MKHILVDPSELDAMMPELDAWYGPCRAAAGQVIADVLDHLPDEGVFLDVGANVGAVTCAAIERRDATVYAFEPIPLYAAYIQRRCPDAKVYPVALGADYDRKLLWCDDHNRGWNTFESEKATPGMHGVNVTVMPLDAYPEMHPDVMKIDTEGYEWAVIRGGHRLIETHRPVIVAELGWGIEHPHRAEVVTELEWLFSIGYKRVPYEYVNVTTDFVLEPE